MAVIISILWISAVALLPMVGSAQTSWFPAVRATRPATYGGVPETVAQELRSGLIFWMPANTSQVNAAWSFDTSANDVTQSLGATRTPVWTNLAAGAHAFGMTQFWQRAAFPSSTATQVTIAAWALSTLSGVIQIAAAQSDNGSAFSYALRYDGARWTFVTGDNPFTATSICTANVSTATGIWTRVVGVISNGAVQIYLNGVLRGATNTVLYGNIGPTNFTVGSYSTPATPRFWQGFISDVRVWSRPLSSNEIFSLDFGPTNFGQRRVHSL